MSSNIDLESPGALDAAIKMVYKSRPAKAAALMGLVGDTNTSIKTSAVGRPSSAFNPLMPMGHRNATDVNLGPVKGGLKNTMGDNSQQLNAVTPASKLDFSQGSNTLTTPTSNLGTIAKGDGMAKMNAFLSKQAMSEAELLQYYGGAGDLMEATGDPSLTPSQMGALGAGGVGIAAANRGRAKNVARREISNIRKQYLQAVQEGALDKQKLRLLNKELQLRGARPTLSLAPTVGIADAQMARAEQDLGSKILKKRYRGAIPLIAATMLGTMAYNQLS